MLLITCITFYAVPDLEVVRDWAEKTYGHGPSRAPKPQWIEIDNSVGGGFGGVEIPLYAASGQLLPGFDILRLIAGHALMAEPDKLIELLSPVLNVYAVNALALKCCLDKYEYWENAKWVAMYTVGPDGRRVFNGEIDRNYAEFKCDGELVRIKHLGLSGQEELKELIQQDIRMANDICGEQIEALRARIEGKYGRHFDCLSLGEVAKALNGILEMMSLYTRPYCDISSKKRRMG